MGCMDEDCSEDPYCHECPLTPSETVTVTVGENLPNVSGDANIDGALDVLDVIIIVNYVLSNPEFDESTQLLFYLIDVNKDYQVNILDIVQVVSDILRY